MWAQDGSKTNNSWEAVSWKLQKLTELFFSIYLYIPKFHSLHFSRMFGAEGGRPQWTAAKFFLPASI
jgi:hypothetical protein